MGFASDEYFNYGQDYLVRHFINAAYYFEDLRDLSFFKESIYKMLSKR